MMNGYVFDLTNKKMKMRLVPLSMALTILSLSACQSLPAKKTAPTPPPAIESPTVIVEPPAPVVDYDRVEVSKAARSTLVLDEEEVLSDEEVDVGVMTDLGRVPVPLNAISPSTLQNFVTVIDAVRNQYIGNVSDEDLFGYAMSGMLKKVDTYGEYLDKTALENLKAFTEGSVANVGLAANFSIHTGQWVVDYVVPDSPADKAGIRIGDYLHEIGSIRLNDGHTNQDITQLLSGIAGTQLDVVVSHAGRGKRTVTLQRNITQTEGVSVSEQDGIAIVRLPVFTARTKDELVQGLASINTPIFGIVIDVRNNPGGVLTSAIDVAGLFLVDKPTVQVVGKETKSAKVLRTQKYAPLQKLPVVILQNRYSASAAEVLSAIFLANGGAVAGELSYGKGSVQSVISLGNEEAIKLTTAYYQMADGKKIDGIGVTPTLSFSEDTSIWLDQAVQYLQDKKPPKGIMLTLADDY